MNYLTDRHQDLASRQTSHLLQGFDRFGFDQKLIIISISLTLGLTAAALSWCGTQSDRVYFCARSPSGETCTDTNNKPLKMTTWYWQQWGKDGRPKQVKAISSELATNPYKPFYAFGGFIGFALAGWMLRHLQYSEKQLQELEAVAHKRDLALAEMQAMREVELVANDQAALIQQAEIFSQTEIQITQMEAEDAVFEAVTAGMTEQQRQQYVNFLRQQKTPYLEGTQTLQGTIDPKDKVSGREEETTIERPPEAITPSWVNNLVCQTALIWGNQGGGKSWLARYVVKLKKNAGYKVVVLDPDSNRAEWVGVESYHSWDDIETQIRLYVNELEARLQEFNESTLSEEEWRSHLWSSGKATALIIEEATTYGSFIKDAELLEKFGKLALTKSRKQEMPVLVVSHNNTQSCLFGIKGLYNLVSKMLQVECLAAVDPVSLQPRATGRARVKLDSSNEWLEVELPKLTTKMKDFGKEQGDGEAPTGGDRTTQPTSPHLDRTTLEKIWSLEFNLEPLEPQLEPLNRPQGNHLGEPEQRFTPTNLTREQALNLINGLRGKLNQTELIELLWQCKKGGSATWRAAHSEFKSLMGGE